MASFEWLIGLRYTRAKRRNGFISFISLVSVLGIALGVATLIIVLSVMNGFQRDIRNRTFEVTSHLQITGYDGRLNDWRSVAQSLNGQPGLLASAPFVEGQSLLYYDGASQGTIVRGIEPELENRVTGFAARMAAGRLEALKPDGFGIVLGSVLARSLGVSVGDKLTVYTTQGNVTPAGVVPRLRRFTVVGIVSMDIHLYDATLALIHLSDAQKLFRMGEQVSGLRYKLSDPMGAPALRLALERQIDQSLLVRDWTLENVDYFRAVQMEKRMLTLILTLIVAVAAFNLVSTLVMAVTDKQADIAILRTLGASPGSIMRIFMIQGASSGIFGTLCGVLFGVLVAYNVGDIVAFLERLFGVQFLSASVYMITKLPSEIQSEDVVTIAIVSLLLSFIATLYPSWRASRVNPAEALRYE
ncbi:lipoprotein-releasing ABC transporter permease subunit [Chitinimonas lacunae]|uniref:Lipoprotein-releasing ABC transporter permease subunit n=1 Tax=Chitinimonas lacunae TaxID=1963018 RepID=A0ABV8MJ42_9NEIS